MRILAALSIGLVALAVVFSAPAVNADLRTQLQALAERHGFVIDHLERVGDAPGRAVAGDLTRQLTQLLKGFNFVLVSGPGASIERVLISGAKSAAPPASGRFVVPLQREGAHHLVSAVLVGPSPNPSPI